VCDELGTAVEHDQVGLSAAEHLLSRCDRAETISLVDHISRWLKVRHPYH
jgi:hypothetical protein